MPPIRIHIPFNNSPRQSSPPDETSSSAESQKGGPRSSWVWDYGKRIKGKPGAPDRWVCGLCPRSNPQTYSIRTTSNAAEHLGKKHRMTEDGSKISTNQKTIKDCRPIISADILRKLIVEWIVDRRHAFNEIEAESFRRIIEYLDVAAVSKLPKTADTIRADTIRYFQEAKSTIIELLSMAKGMIHLSFDLWTSPNHKHMIALTAHWTSPEYTIKTLLLAIREVKGSHTGKNISEIVYEVAKEYGMVEKLGFFMMDGASNNDTSIEELDIRIRKAGGTGFNPKARRWRCFGHIQNSVIRKLLFGKKHKDREKKIKELEIHHDEEEPMETASAEDREIDMVDVDVDVEEHGKKKDKLEEEIREHWRALGAVGKLHNLTKWVRLKPQRRLAFLDRQLEELQEEQPFILRADNDTRWNSTWNMIDSALKQRSRVKAFCMAETGLAKDRLADTDWSDLEEIMELLKPFKYLTMVRQEKGTDLGSIGTVLPGMDILLEILEKARGVTRSKDSPFQQAVDAAWRLLTKYYKLIDQSPAYIAFIVLDPRLKFDYFERKWQKD